MAKFFKKKRTAPKVSHSESHLKNLISLTMADGHMAEIENHLLISIAHRLGLNEEDIKQIASNLDTVEFSMPEKYEDKIEQFEDLLLLMAIDDHIDPNEELVIKEIAKRFELTHVVLDQMLAKYR